MNLINRTSVTGCILALSFFFTACDKGGDIVPPPPDPPLPYQEIKDISYGPSGYQKFDVYLPAGRTENTTKVLVLAHGGGWNQGDKSEFNPFIVQLHDKYPELAIVNINYRLAGDYTRHPAQMEDFRTIFSKLDSFAPVWKTSKKYALGGGSAGGHLSMLYAYKWDTERRVKAVISLFGPANLQDQYYKDNLALHLLIANYTGYIHDLNPQSWFNASPVNHITPTSAPTLMLYGAQDPLVPNSNHILLKQRLDAAGVANEYTVYPDEGHGLANPANATDALNKLVNFIKIRVN